MVKKSQAGVNIGGGTGSGDFGYSWRQASRSLLRILSRLPLKDLQEFQGFRQFLTRGRSS